MEYLNLFLLLIGIIFLALTFVVSARCLILSKESNKILKEYQTLTNAWNKALTEQLQAKNNEAIEQIPTIKH